MTRIALDAMGGDNAPGEIVRGGVEAAESLADVKVLLVGVQSQIEAELAKYPKAVEAAQKVGRLEVVHAPDVAEMDESPVTAVRRKKDCSINVAMRLVKEGKADAFVSAGNSGAVATSAILNLGRIPGVLRPAIATVLPTRRPIRPLLLLDAGEYERLLPLLTADLALRKRAHAPLPAACAYLIQQHFAKEESPC